MRAPAGKASAGGIGGARHREECGFFFSSRRRHTRLTCDWSSDVCSSDLRENEAQTSMARAAELGAPDDSGYPAVVANKLANAHLSLGHDYRAAGSLEHAIHQYRRALEVRPHFNDIRLALARALIEHGDYSDATAVLDEVLRVRPSWLDAMLLRGLAAYLQGDLDAAGTIWTDASMRHPEEPRLEIYRSMLARRQQELSDA